jgi:hypothetical protein
VFGYGCLALTTFLAIGAAAQAPRKQAVEATQRSSAATTHAQDVLRALIEHIEWAPEDRIAAHPRLNPTLLEDLRAVLGNRLSPLVSSPGYLIADNVVTIDDVEVKGDTAFVTVTYGPVPAKPLVECGTKITFVLHRLDKWQVDKDKAWAKCAFAGTRAPTDEEEALREVFRLAMSEIHVGLGAKFVAGRELSPLARRVLAAATNIYDAADVATSEFTLPKDHIILSKLTIDGRSASIEATRGPVPANPTLACGSGHIIRFRREGQGWAIAEHKFVVC